MSDTVHPALKVTFIQSERLGHRAAGRPPRTGRLQRWNESHNAGEYRGLQKNFGIVSRFSYHEIGLPRIDEAKARHDSIHRLRSYITLTPCERRPERDSYYQLNEQRLIRFIYFKVYEHSENIRFS
jgi:hypothetical protein